MPTQVSTQQLTKSFGSRTLFEEISFSVNDGEKVGLIGPNGAGKSTLLSIISGSESPDSGVVSFAKGVRLGWLKQNPTVPLEGSVEQAVLDVGHDASTGQQILSRFDLSPYAHRKVSELSGGWRKRVALAMEMAKEPTLLLLDEPTNHLDIESIIWLEEFLAKSSVAILMVTHDRVFLQRVVNRVLDLDKRNPKGLLDIPGDYENYVRRKSEVIAAQASRQTRLENKLRREVEWLRQGAKARTTKQQARIQAAGELSTEVAALQEKNNFRSARIEFAATDRKPKRLIEAIGVSKGFGSNTLFSNYSIFIGPGDRVGLLGRNGSGKSTLIKVLLGELSPDTGEVRRAEPLRTIYFEQNRDSLDLNQTLKQAIYPHSDHVNYRGSLVHVNAYLDRFLFRKEQFDMSVGRLSGGEQARLLLARLMLQEADVLVLDEPTNDLDAETLDILQDCLSDFDGAVILVTHDRFFLNQVSTQIEAFTPSGVITFADVFQWEESLKVKKNQAPVLPVNREKSAPTKKRRLGFNETRELEQMETKIAVAEERLAKLQSQANDPGVISNASKLTEIYTDVASTQLEIDTLYARWAELEKLKAESQ